MRYFILFLLLPFLSIAQDRFVTTSASGSGNGLSEGTAWTLSQANANAAPGMTINVKAGDYGYQSGGITIANSGTAGNPIVWRGYTTTPGDLDRDEGEGPGYTRAQWVANSQELPTNIYPIIRNFPVNDEPLETDDGFLVLGKSYVTIKNFMVRGMQYGVDIRSSSSNITVDNVITYYIGDYNPSDPNWLNGSVDNPTNQKGVSFRIIGGSNNVVRNSMSIDAGFVHVWFISTTGGGGYDVKVYNEEAGNGADYMFEINDCTGVSVRNYVGERNYDLNGYTIDQGHQSRLLALKKSYNSDVRNISGRNVRVQVNVDSDDNYFENVYLEGLGTGGNQGEFQIMGLSDNNVIRNLEIYKGGGINFLAWVGLEGGFPLGNYNSGSNNVFINPIVWDVAGFGIMGAVFFSEQSGTGVIPNNYIVNGVFHDIPRVLAYNRTGEITFINSTFSTVYSTFASSTNGTSSTAYTMNFINCAFETNAFNGDISTVYNSNSSDTNTEYGNPLFTNATAGDFTLTSTSSSLYNTGTDATLLSYGTNTLAGDYVDIDFIGASRPFGGLWDIGAYELGATPPPATCSDGIQNGDETGIDCGGSCPPCDSGGGDPIANTSILKKKKFIPVN